jgi:3'-5' exoribonuclease
METEPKVTSMDLINTIRLINDQALWYFMHFFFTTLDNGPNNNFFTAAGSSNKHHSYPGGLAYHTLHAARLGHKISETYNARGITIDSNLVVAGILIHDIGKMKGYKVEGKDSATGKWIINKTDTERLFHHIPTGYLMVSEAAERYNKTTNGQNWPLTEEIKNKLLHIILAHHGRKAWSSPVLPQFIEAYVVHIVEFMDGIIDKFNSGEIPDNYYENWR